MKYGRYGWSHLFMSWGLGIVFLWIGLDMFRHGDAWIGYLPQQIPGGLSRETALLIAGGLDAALGIGLILRVWPKLVALTAVVHLIGILIQNGLDAVLIRDVGLLGVALALLTWPVHYRKHQWWMVWGKKKSDPVEEE